MMQLFGGFGSAVFSAYNEKFPLAEAGKRIPHQWVPLLLHVLFGGGMLLQRCRL